MHTLTPQNPQDTVRVLDRVTAERERVLEFIMGDRSKPCGCIRCRAKRIVLEFPMRLADRNLEPPETLRHAIDNEIIALIAAIDRAFNLGKGSGPICPSPDDDEIPF